MFFALSALLALSTVLHSQHESYVSQEGQSQPMGPVMFGGPKDEPDRLAKLAMAKRLNADRQKQMALCTDRLLRLAADLKAETSLSEAANAPAAAPAARTESPANSAASAKKAEEIAKLAHTIRQKMAENYSSP